MKSQSIYANRAWRKVRLIHLSDNPLCVICHHHNKITLATQVDHIIPITIKNHSLLFLEFDNFQSLCASCHAIVTNNQKHVNWSALTIGEAREKKLNDYILPRIIGIDGYPLKTP